MRKSSFLTLCFAFAALAAQAAPVTSHSGVCRYRPGTPFTAWHPLMTRSGLKAARAVQLGDEVLGEDGAYHPVTVRQPYTGNANRSVFNLRLSAASQAERDHMMAAGGIVTGDFFLQNKLKAAQKPAK